MKDGKQLRPKTSDRAERKALAATREAEEQAVRRKLAVKAELQALRTDPTRMLATFAVRRDGKPNTFSTAKMVEASDYTRSLTLLKTKMVMVRTAEEYVEYRVKSSTDHLLPGPRVTLFHGTNAALLVKILEEGLSPSTNGLLGPGVYIGPISKALNYRKITREVLQHANTYSVREYIAVYRAEGKIAADKYRNDTNIPSDVALESRGVILEVEAVLGNVQMVEPGCIWADYMERLYKGTLPDTFYGKALVTPAGYDYSTTLQRDEYCVRQDHNKRLRIVGASVYK